MRGHNDGFIHLKKVKSQSKDQFADIWILCDQYETGKLDESKLTGIARIITYKKTDSKKVIQSIIEGEMVNGMI